MRHRVRGRKLARTVAHREALRRNLVQSLIEHGSIRTTVPKAREVRAFAEKLVTLAIDGTLDARRRATALLNDRSFVPAEHRAAYDRLSDAKREKALRSPSGRRYRVSTTRPGATFTGESIIHKLFAGIAPEMKRRNETKGRAGGYTRIVPLPERRIGDASPLCILEWVAAGDKPRVKGSDRTERKRKSRVRYAFYAGKALPRRNRRASGAATETGGSESSAPAAE